VNGVNLIPKARLAARGRRMRLHTWGAAAGLCAAALVAAYGVLRASWGGDSGPLIGEIQRLTRDLDTMKRRVKSVEAETKTAKAKAQAARSMSEQPDWGLLLSLIANRLGPDAALDACHLEPVKVPGAPPAQVKDAKAAAKPGTPGGPARPERYTLLLTGVARSQDTASRVALDLKETGLFEDVAVETRRTPFMGGEAVTFRIECGITDSAGGDR